MNKNHTIRILIISGIIMIFSILTFIFLFRVIIHKNEHTSALLSNLANKISRKENIDTLTKKIDEVESTKKDIDQHFVNSTEIDSYIDYLEKLGTSAGAEVKVENFEVSTDDKNVLFVRLSAKGTFNNVIKTLLLLENAPYKIHITGVTIGQQSQPTVVDSTGKITSSGASLWQETLSFSILTS